MDSLSGPRPPQFSEDDAWLPAWLHQCNGRQFDVEGIKEDHVTFEQRVEELLCLQKGINNEESLRGEGWCNIGQLFISGTDSTPFSWPQSADNVVKFHLCLSSDGNSCLSSDDNSENTIPTIAAREADPNHTTVIQPLETLEDLGQKDVKLSTFFHGGAINCSQTVEFERLVNKNEFLEHDGNVNFYEAPADAVELCIAASEALVINEVIESDSLEKSFSASATLEASLHLKQARLEVWSNTFGGSVSTISDTDYLSDLDDITMGSAYEDTGVHFIESPGNELSVSQVKDTLESKCDEELQHKKTGASATISDKSCNYNYSRRMENVIIDNNIQSSNNLAADSGGNKQKKVICDTVCDLGNDVEFLNDCLQTVDAQAKLHLSVSTEKANKPIAEKNHNEASMSSSAIMNYRDGEKDYGLPKTDEERFQSRWFGGWTSNNELRDSAVKRIIPEPFVGETSFFSESADAAPDENSFVQNRVKGAITASQLSIPSENFSDRPNDGVLPSQDVGSPSASLVDPLCSVVPCSISENICSAPATHHEDPVVSRRSDVSEHKKDHVPETSHLDNMPGEGEKTTRQTADINDSRRVVSRRSTSLKNYSTLLPSNTKFFEDDSHQKRSFLKQRNAELTFQETYYSREETVKIGAERPVTNNENIPSLSVVVNHRIQCHLGASISSMDNFSEGNPIRTAQTETAVKCLPCENPQWKVSQCKNQSAQKLSASKRVHFSEKEINVPENKRYRKAPTALKSCSTRSAKRSTRSSGHLETRVRHLDKYLRNNLDKEKKRLIFQNMEFLLTGFSQQKEKEIEGIIRKYGGIVLTQAPFTNFKGKRSSMTKSQVLPIVLCLKKIQSFKFLYGCAVNAYVLRVNWLMDSIAAGSVLPPKRYMILSRNISRRHDQVYTAALKYNTQSLVFNNLGVMLHGKTKHFTNITTIIKCGGGQVFKTLQKLVQALESGRISTGVVVVDEEIGASRHLKHCALEQNIPMTSVYWIIKCLYAGQFIPLEEKKNSQCLPVIKLQKHQDSMELSQEI